MAGSKDIFMTGLRSQAVKEQINMLINSQDISAKDLAKQINEILLSNAKHCQLEQIRTK